MPPKRPRTSGPGATAKPAGSPNPMRKANRKAVKFALPPSPLVELPTEILNFICDAVSENASEGERFPDHLQDLVHLARTCKRMQSVTQHILYRNIVSGCTKDDRPRRINLPDLVSSSLIQIFSLDELTSDGMQIRTL